MWRCTSHGNPARIFPENPRIGLKATNRRTHVTDLICLPKNLCKIVTQRRFPEVSQIFKFSGCQPHNHKTRSNILLEPAGIFRILVRSVALHIGRPGRKWKRALLVVKRQEQADLIIIHCQLTTQPKQLGVRLPG